MRRGKILSPVVTIRYGSLIFSLLALVNLVILGTVTLTLVGQAVSFRVAGFADVISGNKVKILDRLIAAS
jgi:hypothetical protein